MFVKSSGLVFVLSKSEPVAPAGERETTGGDVASCLQSERYTCYCVSEEMSSISQECQCDAVEGSLRSSITDKT